MMAVEIIDDCKKCKTLCTIMKPFWKEIRGKMHVYLRCTTCGWHKKANKSEIKRIGVMQKPDISGQLHLFDREDFKRKHGEKTYER